MSMVKVGARLPASSLTSAAINLNLPPNTSKTGMMRAALALFHGHTRKEAIELAQPRFPIPDNMSGGDHLIDIVGDIEEDLANIPDNVGRATAVRIGLAMASGWSRKDAEEAARMARGPKPKRQDDAA